MDYKEWESMKIGDKVKQGKRKGTIVNDIGIGYVVKWDDGVTERITNGLLKKIESKESATNCKDFSGYKVFSMSDCCKNLNGKFVEKTIRKAFPDDDSSTLYVVKLKGIRGHIELYEDEMYK